MDYGDTMIGLQALKILKQAPSFKAVSVRVPEVYMLDSVSIEEISLVPHLRTLKLCSVHVCQVVLLITI